MGTGGRREGMERRGEGREGMEKAKGPSQEEELLGASFPATVS